MSENQAQSRRDRLRAATLGSSAVHKSAKVSWNGEDYEVRAPTLKQQRVLDRLSTDAKTDKKDNLKAVLFAIIECVYVPGTDEQVFERADFDAIEGRPLSDFVGVFVEALGNLSKEASPENVEKN